MPTPKFEFDEDEAEQFYLAGAGSPALAAHYGTTAPVIERRLKSRSIWRFQRKGICNILGCGKPHAARGLCHSHYNQQDYQHNKAAYLERAKNQREKGYMQHWRKVNSSHVAAYLRGWKARNPQRPRDYESRRRAAVGEGISAEQWQGLLEATDFHCVYCWTQPGRLVMEHVTPLSRGGAHELENIVPACWSCNASKRDKLIEEWLV